MNLETKDFVLQEFELKEEGSAMTITGYGSTFGGEPDAVGDVIARGAFVKSLQDLRPKMLYQHDSHQPCVVWDDYSEDTKGLLLKGRFLSNDLGRNTWIAAKEGALESLSIGFRTKKASFNKERTVRTLEEVSLPEVSIVTFPANENARIVGVKTALTARVAEKALRDAGFSREEAKTILSSGIKAIGEQRDAVSPDYAEVLSIFQSISQPQ